MNRFFCQGQAARLLSAGRSNTMRTVVAALYLLLAFAAPARAADRLDPEPRIAVLSAYEPEWKSLKANLGEAKSYHANGVEFVTGTLSGRKVVLFLSGVSMADSSRRPGYPTPYPDFGMIFPTDVEVRSARGGRENRFWFESDPDMLAAAGRIGAVAVKRCTAAQACLSHEPRLVVGGNGVSGSAFVDNAAFRRYAFEAFKAQVLDMESAAVATVAYANGVPFISFRSLSDLAGGDEGANELRTFM
jgi:adenosylhomocysteine nucleosidase